MRRAVLTNEHEVFRASTPDFIALEVAPVYGDWEEVGHPPHEFDRQLSKHGVRGPRVRAESGKGGASRDSFTAVLMEEIAAAGVALGCADPPAKLPRDRMHSDAAEAKLFYSERSGFVTDEFLQLHGGYGDITEYAIARIYADARVTRIYGGTTEVTKPIIAKAVAP
jgi:alkylation response protein AidB-like acyl-CoA dehydrogenase